MKKNIIAMLLTAALSAALLTACGDDKAAEAAPAPAAEETDAVEEVTEEVAEATDDAESDGSFTLLDVDENMVDVGAYHSLHLITAATVVMLSADSMRLQPRRMTRVTSGHSLMLRMFTQEITSTSVFARDLQQKRYSSLMRTATQFRVSSLHQLKRSTIWDQQQLSLRNKKHPYSEQKKTALRSQRCFLYKGLKKREKC